MTDRTPYLTPNPHCNCHACGKKYDMKYQNVNMMKCQECGFVEYKKQGLVGVILVPDKDDKGFVIVKRGIEPQKGMWALPGGFAAFGENWRRAAARELIEEANIEIFNPEENIECVGAETIPDGRNTLVFGKIKGSKSTNNSKAIKSLIRYGVFSPNEETEDIGYISTSNYTSTEHRLAFPLHNKIIKEQLKIGQR